MKNSVFAGFVLLVLFFAFCTKDSENDAIPIEVEKKNTALFTKQTATWCGLSGTWGWTLNAELVPLLEAESVCVSLYGSGASLFYNKAAAEFCYRFSPGSGWPTFCVNATTQMKVDGFTINDPVIIKAKCLHAIDSFMESPVIANSGFRKTSIGETIQIKTRTEFFQDGGDGEYYICAYLVEDSVMGIQKGQTGIVQHDNVLRGSAHNTSWGERINSALTAGSTFDHTFSARIDPTWNPDKIKVFTVIWKKTGATSYEFVNAHKP
jgi:hypothetical protein